MAITLSQAREYIRKHIDFNGNGMIDNYKEGDAFCDWYAQWGIAQNKFDKQAASAMNSVMQDVCVAMYSDPLGKDYGGDFEVGVYY